MVTESSTLENSYGPEAVTAPEVSSPDTHAPEPETKDTTYSEAVSQRRKPFGSGILGFFVGFAVAAIVLGAALGGGLGASLGNCRKSLR